jgi:glycine oxidase
MLAPVTEAHYGEDALLQLNLASADLYPRFVRDLEDESGCTVGYRACGTVLVARDQDDNAALSEVFSFQQRLGLQVRRLRSSELRDLEPALSPSVRGGIEVAGDHQVDNRALLKALRLACERREVGFVRDSVSEVLQEQGAVDGVTTTGGARLDADVVVLAAGAYCGSIAGVPPLPVRPVKGQLLHLRALDDAPLLHHNVRGLDVYFVPRPDGRLVIGATVEERGFDPAPTAGAVHDLLRFAFELVPGITELELVEVTVGHRPGTPDNAPLLGPSSVPNVIVATGHYRNGVLLLPVTADAIARLVVTGETLDEIAAFSPARFAPAGQPT